MSANIVLSRKVNKYRAIWADFLFFQICRAFALLTLIALFGILFSLIWGALPAMKQFGVSFLWSAEWNPPQERFGALIPIYGTLITSAIALLIALPVSFGIAFFITELAPVWMKKTLGIAIELLAGVPSIVYGMWGLLVFVPIFSEYAQPWLSETLGILPIIGEFFSGPPIGVGILAAGIVLAIMIIPFIASVMRDVFEVTPSILKESSYALGATRWEVVWNIVLPYTRVGVVGGIMLGLGRALGETMAVTFLIGNINSFQGFSLFLPCNSIASALANEFAEATSDLYTSSLIELGLVLFLITFLVLSASKLLLLRLSKSGGEQA
ncbi:MAG: phosphate ABC transporter permease subunit PstC [Burkholderiales bacterium]|jgi:phosphate transport system permease protein|nr:phosphate ABC transporter permease subunit PstC [Burkholderiales bacterium]